MLVHERVTPINHWKLTSDFRDFEAPLRQVGCGADESANQCGGSPTASAAGDHATADANADATHDATHDAAHDATHDAAHDAAHDNGSSECFLYDPDAAGSETGGVCWSEVLKSEASCTV